MIENISVVENLVTLRRQACAYVLHVVKRLRTCVVKRFIFLKLFCTDLFLGPWSSIFFHEQEQLECSKRSWYSVIIIIISVSLLKILL